MKALKFYAEWCGPCKALSMVVKGAKDKLPMEVEDVDIDNNLFMAQDFKIRGVPAMVIVDDAGKEIRRKVGMMTEEQLLEFLKG
jgi:thioredoxin 1